MKDSSIMPIFNRLPISFNHGKGMYLYDDNKKKYLDALSGMGVVSLGHAHPAILKALTEQAHRIIHTSNTFIIDEQEKLGMEFCEFSGMDKVIFINSGTEASEVAIKLARLYGHARHIANPCIMTFNKGFHGRTLGAMSASGNFELQKGFEPILPGFVYAPYNDIKAVEAYAAENKNICAIMVEPILGQGGVVVPDEDFLVKLRKICDKHHWLLMLDEIQTGMGRTGKNFDYQYTPIKPDVLTSAKALGNGLPIAACATTKEIGSLFTFGKHGTTFGGNPLCCHVARTVIKTYAEEGLIQNAKEVGDYLLNHLRSTLAHESGVVQIRGRGLMIGIELDRSCNDIYFLGLEAGILFNIADHRVIRLLPPFILTKSDADMIVEKLQKCIRVFVSKLEKEKSSGE